VGVTGYTLGGGLGWLARRYGLAANSVIAAGLVTTDGRLVHTDSDYEPDLLWAVRGGGGSVGVVTALEFTLYPVDELYAGDLFFPIERSSEVLHAWREWTDTLPDEVTSVSHILRLPDLPAIADELRGRPFVIVEAAYWGGCTWIQSSRRPPRATARCWPTSLVRPSTRWVSLVGPGADTPLASVEIRQLGGALGRPDPGDGAQPAIDARFLMYCNGMTPTPELTDVVRASARALKDALAPWHADYDFYNLRESAGPASAVLSAEAYRRLQEIKAKYDPEQAIISVHPVWPSRTQS
jgi:FAD/FMN-containing dehydrogenase